MKYRSLAALAATLVVSAAAYAQDVFIDNPTYKKFYLDGVPNFDQRREVANVTIGGNPYLVLGLTDNGSEFCCPTSAVEWSDFLANRGYPGLAPGPGPMTGSYTGGVAGLGEYDAVDISIAIMGLDMQTSGTNGTYGGPAQTGAQLFFNAAYPGSFNMVNIERDNSGFPHIMDMLNASLAGNLIELYGGWYDTAPWNDTTAYYRNGGHCVAMASAIWNNNPSLSLGICNPWTYDGMTVQSAQAYQAQTTTNANEWFVNVNTSNQVIAGSQQYENVDFLDKSENWILDGALEIQPYFGYTIKNGWLYWMDPIKFVDLDVNTVEVPPKYVVFKAPDGTAIGGATRNPLTGEFYYFSEDRGVMYVADPVSGRTTPMKTDFVPRQILFGASVQPFILAGAGTFAMWNPKTNSLSNGLDLGSVSGLIYDHETDSFYWYAWSSTGAPGRFGQILKAEGTDKWTIGPSFSLPVMPTGKGTISVQIANGSLYLFQPGDPYLYQVIIGGLEGYIARYLPAVQDATGFAMDDDGRLYFSLNGLTVVTDLNGNTITSPFNDLPCGPSLEMTHSVSNYHPWLQGTPAWNNRVPAGAFETR